MFGWLKGKEGSTGGDTSTGIGTDGGSGDTLAPRRPLPLTPPIDLRPDGGVIPRIHRLTGGNPWRKDWNMEAPIPWRVFDDCGGAYLMGLVGGGIFHGIKGLRNAPRGNRYRHALNTMRVRGPIVGSNFAIWGGMFSFLDGQITLLRNMDSRWNSVAAGAITGGVLAARAGFRQVLKNGLIGGVLLFVIEGGIYWMEKSQSPFMQEGAVIPLALGGYPPPQNQQFAGEKPNEFQTRPVYALDLEDV